MEARLDNSLFKGLTVPMLFFLSSFKVPMCLLGCSGFAFLCENAKKSLVICMLFYFHLFSYRVFSTLVYPFVLHCLFSLKFTYPNSPFCVFSFFFSFPSSISHPPLWLSFFSRAKKEKKKKKVGEGLFMVNGMYQSERTRSTEVEVESLLLSLSWIDGG